MVRPALFIATIAGLAARPLSACDPAWLPSVRLPGTAIMVVRFSHDTVADLVRPRFNPERATAFEGYLSLRRRTSYGQRATIDAVDGRSRWRPPAGAAVILVPWEFGPDCEPFPFSQTAKWAQAEVPSVVTGWLRPKAGWIGGVPTLDVEKAGFEPRWVDHDPRWPHDRRDMMSALEYLTFVQILPTRAEFERRPAEVRRRIDSWALAHPALATKEPGATILANLRRLQ